MNTVVCRSPYGERGLKFGRIHPSRIAERSLSLRRAWIEIIQHTALYERMKSRSPYGERGLKWYNSGGLEACGRRSPYGERGLKW